MKIRCLTIKAAAVLFLSFNLNSWAGAGLENQALRDSDFGRMELPPVPGVPMPGMETAQGAIASGLDSFNWFGYTEVHGAIGVYSANPALYSIYLKSITNVYLKPDATFTTGKGTKVHVSATKASNCPDGGSSCEDKEKLFVVLTTDKNETLFVRGMEILNWGPISGSRTVIIDGEKHVVKLYANTSTPANSKLQIKGPSGMVFNATVQQVGDAMAGKCVDMELSKAYKLAYGNEVVQGPNGAKFTSKMLVLMLPFPVTDISSFTVINAADITPDGVTFPSFEPGFGFRLDNGTLEIYKL
jgi:hypothetical protein